MVRALLDSWLGGNGGSLQHSRGRLMREMAIRCADNTCEISALIPTLPDVSLLESSFVSAEAGFRVCVPPTPSKY
jgi:hypothetical protein